jgi:Flp pilus assembly protein CpaB
MTQSPTGYGTGRSSIASTGNTKLLIAALVTALLAVVLVNLYVQSTRRSLTQDSFTAFRLTVSKQPGDRLDARDVETVSVPNSFREAFNAAVQPNDRGEPLRLGDVFTRSVEAGDFLREQHFDDVRTSEEFNMVTPGMRAVALPVNSAQLPEPLRPEMRVDLEAAFPAPQGPPRILPVMENVRVIAIDSRTRLTQRTRGSGGGGSRITIEVTPEQATQLMAVTSQIAGEFFVHLRRIDDRSAPKIPGGGINPRVIDEISQALGPTR